MHGLGYERYGAHGSDWGSAVTTFMALDTPGPMLGIHLANLDLRPYTGPGSRPLSEAEEAYISQYRHWREDDYDLTTLRTGIMAGSICPVEVMKRCISETASTRCRSPTA